MLRKFRSRNRFMLNSAGSIKKTKPNWNNILKKSVSVKMKRWKRNGKLFEVSWKKDFVKNMKPSLLMNGKEFSKKPMNRWKKKQNVWKNIIVISCNCRPISSKEFAHSSAKKWKKHFFSDCNG